MDYTNFLTKSGYLNHNLVSRVSSSEFDQLRILGGTTTASITTTIYCIHHNIPCKVCETCSKELDVENFKNGWKPSKRFCSIGCKSSFDVTKSTSNKVLEDYSLVLDQNGNPSSGKIDKFINLATIEDLQRKTGLSTTNINTLLYAGIHKDFIVKKCLQCDTELDIHNFKTGYREDQKFCSIECKDVNKEYRENLSEKKSGVSRYVSENFVADVLNPWFLYRTKYLYDMFDLTTHTSLDEYISDKTTLKFSCNICLHNFTSNFSNNGRIPRCPICKSRSKQQVEISKFITSLGYNIIFNDREQICPYEIDIFIPSLNIGIEYDGFYWHHDKDHSDKYVLSKKSGIRMIRIFQDEFKNKKQIVFSRLRAILGKIENKIYGRDCSIVELGTQQSREFFDENHIQGNVDASIRYGLLYEGQIVAAMTFSYSRFDKNSQWELIRFSNKLDTIVIGGASKLFSHFVKIKSPTSVISYCDIRYGNGRMYEQIGFEYKLTTKSNYFYYKNGVRYSRIKFQKHKLKNIFENFDPVLTESENMENNGYLKIYDSGNMVYNWSN